MSQKIVDLAIEIVTKRKKPIKFYELFEQVSKKLNLSEEEANDLISSFYEELSLNPQLVNIGNNYWTLRNRCKYDDIKIDIDDEEEEEEDLDSEEDDELDYSDEEDDNEESRRVDNYNDSSEGDY